MRFLQIKLKRIGRWKKPVYAVVVARKDFPVNSGQYFEKIGFYSPASKTKFFFLNFSRVAYWLSRGALVTTPVGLLLGKFLPVKK